MINATRQHPTPIYATPVIMNAPASTTPFDLGPLLGTHPLVSTRRQFITLSAAVLLFIITLILVSNLTGAARLLIPLITLLPAILLTRLFISRLDTHVDFGLNALRLRRGSTTRRTIPYSDITHFQYHTYSPSLKLDSASPPKIRLRITTRDGFRITIHSPRHAPTFRATLPPLAHLDYARESIAAVMSNALHAQYTQTQRVDWTTRLRFENTDLVYTPLIGTERRIPIASATATIHEGFRVSITNPQNQEPVPFCSITRDHPHLWSGMALLVRLQFELAQSKPAAEPPTPTAS